MNDLILKAPNKKALEDVFSDLALRFDATEMHSGSRFQTEVGEWSFVFFGKVLDRDATPEIKEDENGNEFEIYPSLEGVFGFLRWNGNESQSKYWLAAAKYGIEKYWSDDGSGIVANLPAWFPRIA